MKKTSKRSLWAWVGALAAGCGLCCIPLIVPLLGGTALAGGLSLVAGEGVPWDLILCGGIFVGGGGVLFWLASRRKASKNNACPTEVSPNQASIFIKPLEKSSD